MPCRETNPLKNHSIEVENIDFNVNELTPIQVKLVSELLKNSADIFAATNPGTTHLVNHHIDVGDSLPVHSIPYRTSPKEREIIQTEVDKMLKAKVIQPSRSPWAAPIVLITKKDGSIRFCIDYRKLNFLITKDVYSLLRIDDSLAAVSGGRWFSTFDLTSSYWQIPVADSSKDKTAYITANGLF